MSSILVKAAAFFALGCLIFAPQAAFAGSPREVPPVFKAPVSVEAWRIRIENAQAGPVRVSIDQGKTWALLGRVVAPATRHLQGYLAAGYAPIGTVAATAVHGIRIRVGDTSTAYPALINVLPSQFAQTPNYFGGHISGDSGIYTDIPAGVGLFRDFAPLVGSQVYVKSAGSTEQPLPVNYAPQIGDELTIIVKRPVNPLREIDFDNHAGGNVTVTYADGTTQVVTHVVDPVKGVGRFDGTSYTGVGAINTNHTCVITVSTAPVSDSPEMEGTGDERRGGFQIVPSYHITQTEEAGAPQMLSIGVPKPQGPSIEGTPPLFYGYLSLAWSPDDPEHSWICDVKHEGDANWQPMPTLIGNQPDALAKLKIVALRISRQAGPEDPAWLPVQEAKAASDYVEMRKELAESGKEPISRGNATISMQPGTPTGSYAQLLVDGEMIGLTNTRPYSFEWDTLRVPDGEHMVEAKVVDDNGNMLADERNVFWVDNANALQPVKSASSPTAPARAAVVQPVAAQ